MNREWSTDVHVAFRRKTLYPMNLLSTTHSERLVQLRDATRHAAYGVLRVVADVFFSPVHRVVVDGLCLCDNQNIVAKRNESSDVDSWQLGSRLLINAVPLKKLLHPFVEMGLLEFATARRQKEGSAGKSTVAVWSIVPLRVLYATRLRLHQMISYTAFGMPASSSASSSASSGDGGEDITYVTCALCKTERIDLLETAHMEMEDGRQPTCATCRKRGGETALPQKQVTGADVRLVVSRVMQSVEQLHTTLMRVEDWKTQAADNGVYEKMKHDYEDAASRRSADARKQQEKAALEAMHRTPVEDGEQSAKRQKTENAGFGSGWQPPSAASPTADGTGLLHSVTVCVAGKRTKLIDITDALLRQMTPEEMTAYDRVCKENEMHIEYI
jgi:hypothetical protein